MPTQEDFPPEWQCASENKRVAVEVLSREVESFDTFSGEGAEPQNITENWIEIPTTSVEQWVEKGDAAAIQRTAKVEFPLEWGTDDGTVEHNSPRRLVDSAAESQGEPFGFARIWFQNAEGEWILTHLGWIGGVGPTGNGTTGKFWIYDFAELLSSVPIGVTFDNPTLRQAMEQIARITNDNTPIPVGEVKYIPPTGEEIQAYTSRDEFEDEIAPSEFAVNVPEAENVQRGDFSQYFTNDSPRVAIGQTAEAVGLGAPAGTTYDATGTIDTSQGDAETRSDALGEAVSGDVGDSIGTAIDPDEETTVKKFVENHDTLGDVYEWLQRKIEGKVHFEPNLNSVTMLTDVSTSRRVFAQDSVVDEYEGIGMSNLDWVPSLLGDWLPIDDLEIPYAWHEEVSVINNDALFEMKPINTLHLRGDTSKSLVVEGSGFDGQQAQIGSFGGAGFRAGSKTYPVVKVQVPSLLEAAEGVELAPSVVESDADELDKAEREARKQLSDKLEEATEGSILLEGEPRIMPYDRLDSFEVCQGDVTYEQVPVSYEVESVKHVKQSDGTFKTDLNVSIWANDKTIRTVKKEMVEVDDPKTVG